MNICRNWLRGRLNGRPFVRNVILALSDKWLSLDTDPMDEQIIIAQMSFINFGQVHIWFRRSADAMLLVRRTSASQISRQPRQPQNCCGEHVCYMWLDTWTATSAPWNYKVTAVRLLSNKNLGENTCSIWLQWSISALLLSKASIFQLFNIQLYSTW